MYQDMSSLYTYLIMFVSQNTPILKSLYKLNTYSFCIYTDQFFRSLIISCSRFCASVYIVTRNN